MTTPVEPSPKLPENPDDRTVTAEMRAIVEEKLRSHDQKMTFRGWLMAMVTAIGAVAVTVTLTLMFLDNRVLAQTAQANAVQDAKLTAAVSRVETLEKRFDRFDTKMDLMLDAQRVPLSVRPPPLQLDGGR